MSESEQELPILTDRQYRAVEQRVDYLIGRWGSILKAVLILFGGMNIIAIGAGLAQIFIFLPSAATELATEKIGSWHEDQIAQFKKKLDGLDSKIGAAREDWGAVKERMQDLRELEQQLEEVRDQADKLEKSLQELLGSDEGMLLEKLKRIEAFLKDNPTTATLIESLEDGLDKADLVSAAISKRLGDVEEYLVKQDYIQVKVVEWTEQGYKDYRAPEGQQVVGAGGWSSGGAALPIYFDYPGRGADVTAWAPQKNADGHTLSVVLMKAFSPQKERNQ